MRVYGSSPLYNYVELVFRSKRLFIVAIVLTTIITAAVAAFRSGMYTAAAVVLLSGDSQGSAQPGSKEDDDRIGSVRSKLSILNIVQKDPAFMRDAMKERKLDQGRSEEEFDQFCKDASKALNIAVADNYNYLEINIRWKDPKEAEDIINGFYSAYSRYVIDKETAQSTLQTKLLQNLLAEYSSKEGKIRKDVEGYQSHIIGKPVSEFNAANATYVQAQNQVKAYEEEVNFARNGLAEVERQLASTPRTMTEFQESQGPQQSPEYQNLVTAKEKLQADLDELKLKYTDDNPQVKKEAALLEQVNARLARVNAATGLKPGNKQGPISRMRESLNPTWQALDAKRADMEIQVHAQEARLQLQREATQKAYDMAKTAPAAAAQFKSMTDNYTLYSAIRQNLRNRVEQAAMDEHRDRDMHTAEMSMAVKPEAEPDIMGAKTILFYAAGPILGLIIAFAFALLMETLDHSLRTPIEVEKHLGKPVLAVLPRMDTTGDRKSQRRLSSGGGEAARPTLPS
jgi:uncharacterized protein involved in exopolysaccharide biosynthesis